MYPIRQLTTILFFCFLLSLPIQQSLSAETDSILTFPEGRPQKTSHDDSIQLTLTTDEKSLLLSVNFNFKPVEKQSTNLSVGSGSYAVEIDGRLIEESVLSGPKSTVKVSIPLGELLGKEHNITLSGYDHTGKQYNLSKKFSCDLTPHIIVTSPEKQKIVFDPTIELFFPGTTEKAAGILELYLDARPLREQSVSIIKRNSKQLLSEYLDHPLYLADLIPGTHLLKITARGVNGDSYTAASTFTVQAEQVNITVKNNKQGKLESISILYPNTSNSIHGFVEVFCDQGGIIFSKKAENGEIIITEKDLRGALNKFSYMMDSRRPISLTIHAQTSNAVDSWREITFHP